MHQPLSKAQIAAINATDRNVGEELAATPASPRATSSVNSVYDESNWFSVAARVLLAPKPGLVLHLLTDCGERNGDRYASGDVKVPSFVVRQLLRTEHGETWLKVLMEGADAPWWRQRLELQREARLFREIRNKFSE
jgi:hypothetical protein